MEVVRDMSNIVIRPLEKSDYPKLELFCQACAQLDLKNNESFSSIKLDKIVMPYGQYFIALDGDKIYSFAGVHQLPELGPNAWRCLFRGAQLPGYTPTWSMNFFKSGIHFNYFLYEQIKFIQSYDAAAEFYISTNVDNPEAGSSSKLNNIMMPRLVKQGYVSLARENFMLYNTIQNVWKVNLNNYFTARREAMAC